LHNLKICFGASVAAKEVGVVKAVSDGLWWHYLAEWGTLKTFLTIFV